MKMRKQQHQVASLRWHVLQQQQQYQSLSMTPTMQTFLR
jgi:hypothetical protein